METIAINGTLRTGAGTTNSKIDRAGGKVPCILYGGGNNVSFTVNPKDVRDLIFTTEFKIVEVTIDGKTDRCILKTAQFHPVTDNVRHIDFLRLIEGNVVKLDVPVRCVGISPGVKVGGKLQQKMRKVKIKTLPEHMVDHLTVDISPLELGDSVRVRDVIVPEGIELMDPEANPVATIEIPRALRGGDDEEGEEGEEAVAAV